MRGDKAWSWDHSLRGEAGMLSSMGPATERSWQLCAKDRGPLGEDLMESTFPEGWGMLVLQKTSVSLEPFEWSLEGMLTIWRWRVEQEPLRSLGR